MGVVSVTAVVGSNCLAGDDCCCRVLDEVGVDDNKKVAVLVQVGSFSSTAPRGGDGVAKVRGITMGEECGVGVAVRGFLVDEDDALAALLIIRLVVGVVGGGNLNLVTGDDVEMLLVLTVMGVEIVVTREDDDNASGVAATPLKGVDDVCPRERPADAAAGGGRGKGRRIGRSMVDDMVNTDDKDRVSLFAVALLLSVYQRCRVQCFRVSCISLECRS